MKTSTMFTSQYAPSEWCMYLGDEENCCGKFGRFSAASDDRLNCPY